MSFYKFFKVISRVKVKKEQIFRIVDAKDALFLQARYRRHNNGHMMHSDRYYFLR